MVDFHTSQLLTGYGCFVHYLAKIRRESDERCWSYDAVMDDANLTLFKCSTWRGERIIMVLGVANPDNTLKFITRYCRAVVRYANTMIIFKEQLERARKSGSRNKMLYNSR